MSALVLSVADVTEARIAEQLQENLLQEKAVLLQELQHRVANSLQIIASVLMQSARKVHVGGDPRPSVRRASARDVGRRPAAASAVSRLGDVEMRPYLTTLCESIGASMIRDREQLTLDVRGDESINTADTSVSLGLIVTELVINALKHAFPGNRGGRIVVGYHGRGPNWTLSVNDDGVGMPERSRKRQARPGHQHRAGAGLAIGRADRRYTGQSGNFRFRRPSFRPGPGGPRHRHGRRRVAPFESSELEKRTSDHLGRAHSRGRRGGRDFRLAGVALFARTRLQYGRDADGVSPLSRVLLAMGGGGRGAGGRRYYSADLLTGAR